ncbi:MAG: NAD(P)H-binding protein [Nocardioidaceae bacterium]|nr:NAD(P)H-binding protein [Nocardioidaceae bacterium]
MWMVTGGNGRLGRAIVEHLVTIVDPGEVAVGVRDPQIASGLGRLGVEVRRADFEDAAAMRTAFDGIERMVLVSTNAMPHTTRYRHLQDATDAALRAGVDSIVYTSLITTAPEAIGDVHRLSEHYLRRSGARVTLLRHPLYLESFVDDLVGEPSVEAVSDGPINAAWRDDLAEAAARVLADDARLEVYDFTGPTAWRMSDLAAEIERQQGRPMPFRRLSEHDFLRHAAGEGAPDFLRQILLDLQHTIEAGGFAHVTDDLARVLGRPPRSMPDRVAQLSALAASTG